MESESRRQTEDKQHRSKESRSAWNGMIQAGSLWLVGSTLTKAVTFLGVLSIVVAVILDSSGEIYLAIVVLASASAIFADMLADDLPSIKGFLSNLFK